MEVNKEEAARCRDIGAAALRSGQTARAVKMFNKSLQLYPLPGVNALLEQAEKKLQSDEGSTTNTNGSSSASSNSGDNPTNNYSENGFASSRTSSSASMNNASSASSTATGADGRGYTAAQVQIVSQVLKAKEGGRGAHYRVLGIEQTADDAAIKKAYRKLALKLHPDKNSAPHAVEAFKAVGLAYATLSDSQKRTIYDRYGDEDPDNRGGGMGGMRGRGGNMHFNGQEVNPEDIFNMFFGGGMPGGMGGPGFRVYTTGMGPGFAFGGMHPNMQRARRQQQQQQARQEEGLFGQFAQFLPLLVIFLLSFFNMPGQNAGGATGGSRYFSLTPVSPFVNPLHTKLSKVKDIPYFVTDQFVRTIGRDRYQLSQVERMVEESYKRFLLEECNNQKNYKKKLETLAVKRTISEQERNNLMRKANNFDLVRCVELEDLFPQAVPAHSRVKRQHTEF
jgi:DnaJ-domain-containing protein 1